MMISVHWACMPTALPEYRLNPDRGYDAEKLEQDKEICRMAQRAIGNDESRIEKCLEAKGWIAIKKELEKENLDKPVGSTMRGEE